MFIAGSLVVDAIPSQTPSRWTLRWTWVEPRRLSEKLNRSFGCLSSIQAVGVAASDTQSAWRVKTDNLGPANPQFTRVKNIEGHDTLVARWEDGFEWNVPGTTAAAAPQDKCEQTLWSGEDSSDGEKIKVIVVNHANRGIWLAIRKGSRKQELQMVGFAEEHLPEAKKVTMQWAEHFAAGTKDKPVIEAEKLQWLKDHRPAGWTPKAKATAKSKAKSKAKCKPKSKGKANAGSKPAGATAAKKSEAAESAKDDADEDEDEEDDKDEDEEDSDLPASDEDDEEDGEEAAQQADAAEDEAGEHPEAAEPLEEPTVARTIKKRPAGATSTPPSTKKPASTKVHPEKVPEPISPPPKMFKPPPLPDF